MSVRSAIIYDRTGHAAGLERTILRGAGVLRQTSVKNDDALLTALQSDVDLVLINWSGAWDGLIALVRAIRHKQRSPDPFVAIVVVSPTLSVSNVTAALDAGVNSLVRAPFSGADIQRQLALLARPVRFIDAANYFGPDRRSASAPVTPEMEARFGAPCRVIEGEDIDTMRAACRAAFQPRAAS